MSCPQPSSNKGPRFMHHPSIGWFMVDGPEVFVKEGDDYKPATAEQVATVRAIAEIQITNQ